MRSSAIARSISVVAVCLLFSPCAALAARFIDTSAVWSEKYINQLSDQGVINAESDGKFLPDEPVTRAVFAYWLVKVLGLESQPVSNKSSYSDVKPSDWCYKPIEIIRQNNYVGGFADGFRPNQLIQKADFIKIIARTLNTPAPKDAAITQALNNWSDKNKIPIWAKADVAQATIAGVLLTKTPHLLQPTSMVTRGEAAAILCQLNAFITHQNVQDSAAQAEATFPAQTYKPPQNGVPYNAIPPGQYTGRPAQPGGSAPGYYPPPQYSGQPMPYANNAVQPPYYPPQAGYAAPANYSPAVGNGQPAPSVAPPSAGQIVVVKAGTEIHAALKNNLESLGSLIGQPIEATLTAPFSSGAVVLLPAGTTVSGRVTSVVSARKLQFAHDGKIEIKFTSVQTPDGRKLALDASFDSSTMHLPPAPASTAAGGAAKKGVELHLKAGTSVPVKLNQNLQVAAAVPTGPPPGYSQPPGSRQPVNPPQYGAYPSPPVGAYPSPPAGYPSAPAGYPSAPGGYPSAQGGYPSAQGGYPSAPPGYPSAPGGYPSAQGGYPSAPAGYPSAPAGYPSAPAGYPTQQQQPYYPPR